MRLRRLQQLDRQARSELINYFLFMGFMSGFMFATVFARGITGHTTILHALLWFAIGFPIFPLIIIILAHKRILLRPFKRIFRFFTEILYF